MYPGSSQHYSVDTEPVWQPQQQHGSGMDSGSLARGRPSVNGARYVDDSYGDLDSSGQFDFEPGFTQQQVNGASSVIVAVYH